MIWNFLYMIRAQYECSNVLIFHLSHRKWPLPTPTDTDPRRFIQEISFLSFLFTGRRAHRSRRPIQVFSSFNFACHSNPLLLSIFWFCFNWSQFHKASIPNKAVYRWSVYDPSKLFHRKVIKEEILSRAELGVTATVWPQRYWRSGEGTMTMLW